MTAFRTNTWLKSYTIVIVSSHLDNVLVKITPELNHPLSQFINVTDICLV